MKKLKEMMKISKKLIISMLCLILILPNLTFAQEIQPEDILAEDVEAEEAKTEDAETEAEYVLPISIDELGSPKYLTAEFIDDYFLLTWTNSTMAFIQSNEYKLEYQVDYKIGRGQWISAESNFILPTNIVESGLYGKSSAIFNPSEGGLSPRAIDLTKNSYSIRVRYRYVYEEDGIEKHIYGAFSSPVTLGLQPYYSGASEWAFEELDRAVEYGFIAENIRSNMQANITREEFCELVLKMYEKQINKPASYAEVVFSDTTNQEIMKAAGLGIAVGVGDGRFAPNEPVTRQEMAVMIKRTLRLVYPDLDYNGYGAKIFPDDNEISDWAVNGVRFLTKYDIFKGDNEGNIQPLGITTREQAVAIVVRSYEMFKNLGN